jgi:WD40 repeat protein
MVKLWARPPSSARLLAHRAAVLDAALSSDGTRVYTGSVDKIVRTWNVETGKVDRQFSGHTDSAAPVASSPNGHVLAVGDRGMIHFWDQTNGRQTALQGAHADQIVSLAFSPDGKRLLSTSADHTLKVWRVPPGEPELMAHPDEVTCLALSPDGTKVLTGCKDKQARLWDLAKREAIRTFSAHTQAVTSVALRGDGAALATGSADKSLIIWSTIDGKVDRRFANLPAAVQTVAFSPVANVVAAGLADHSIRLFDLDQEKEIRSLAGHGAAVHHVAFTPKGDRLISAGADRTVRLWDPADGTPRGKIDMRAASSCLALSKDGSRFAVGLRNRSVTVWGLSGDPQVSSFDVPAGIRSIDLSADNKRIVVGCDDKHVRVYTIDGELAEFFRHDGPVLAVAFQGDGRQVISAGADKTARTWTPGLSWQTALGRSWPVRGLFTPNGEQVVTCVDNAVRILSAADGTGVKSFAAHGEVVYDIGISADGTRLVSSSRDKTLKVWALGSPGSNEREIKPIGEFNLSAPAFRVAISPNGARVAASSALVNQPMRVFDVALNQEVMGHTEKSVGFVSLAFLPDNRTLLATGTDQKVRLIDVGLLALLPAHPGGVNSIAFHANGMMALTGGADKTVKLWDPTMGKAVKTFGPLSDSVSAVAFSRDATQAASAAGKTVKVWNLADGKELLSLVHPDTVLTISFNADKSRIVTGSADHQTRIWDASTGTLWEAFAQAGPVRSIAVHPSQGTVISASGDKAAVVDTTSVVRAIAVSRAPIRSLAVTPNGSHVLTASDDMILRLWNTTTGVSDRVLAGSDHYVRALAISRNNALVAVGGVDTLVRLYDLAEAKLVGTFRVPADVTGLSFSPDNKLLAAACADKSVLLWNAVYTPGQPVPAEFGKALQKFQDDGPLTGVVFASDNRTLYTSGAGRSLKALKLATEGPTQTFAHPNLVDAVAFNPAGTQLATGCHNGTVLIWDLVKKQQLRVINAHPVKPPVQDQYPVYCVAWSADGKQVVSGSRDHSLKLWDAATGNLVREFRAYKEKDFDLSQESASLFGFVASPFGQGPLLAASALVSGKAREFEKGHRDSVFCVAFSPDGKTLVSGSSDHTIKLWNVADGSVLRELANPHLKPPAADAPKEAHPGWVYGLRYTPDGKYLVSVGNAPPFKSYLAIWSMAEGKLVQAEELPLGTFNSVAVSPDGKLLGVACSPPGRQFQQVDSYLLRMPELK